MHNPSPKTDNVGEKTFLFLSIYFSYLQNPLTGYNQKSPN